MKKSVKALIIIAAVFVVLALAVIIISPEKRRLTDKVRRNSGSDFIELSDGWTEFEVAGPVDGEAVILIHGATVPMYDWDYQFKVLADAGYRVLRYNQYGRGLSDRPRETYDAALYIRQLDDLLESQGWDSAHFVIHSMGGAVAVEFNAARPESVDRLVLISPAYHLAQDHGGIAAVRIPVVGDLLSKTVLPGILAARAESLFVGAGVPDLEVFNESFDEQTRYFGFSRTVKSLFRHQVVDELEVPYRTLKGNETLLIWGTDDSSIPRTHIDSIQALVPGLQTEIINGAGHSPNLEVPDRVNALVLDFLGRDLTPR